MSIYRKIILLLVLYSSYTLACPPDQHEECVLPTPWGCRASVCVPNINVPPLPIPTEVTCAQYIGHPIYLETVITMNENKDELARYGVHDKSSCKDGRDAVVAALATKIPALAAVTWDVGRCACDKVY